MFWKRQRKRTKNKQTLAVKTKNDLLSLFMLHVKYFEPKDCVIENQDKQQQGLKIFFTTIFEVQFLPGMHCCTLRQNASRHFFSVWRSQTNSKETIKVSKHNKIIKTKRNLKSCKFILKKCHRRFFEIDG